MTLRDKIRTELGSLLAAGSQLNDNLASGDGVKFRLGYQNWYTAALAVVRALAPDRAREIELLYWDPSRKKLDQLTYGIADFLLGIGFSVGGVEINIKGITMQRFQQQVLVLQATEQRLDDTFSRLQETLQAQLMDSEIEAARDLAAAKHFRAAGAVAGVVLERHLLLVAKARQVASTKKHPTISEWNDLLKNNGAIDQPTWRLIQRLGDLRNLCCHPKERNPTADEVVELIDQTDKLLKTLI